MMVVENSGELEREQCQRRVLDSLTELHKYQPSLKPLDQTADEDFASSSMRDAAVDRLKCLNRFFRLDPQTFFLAVNYFDRFLTIIKVRPKYLECVSITCYYMAIQHHEPEQNRIACLYLLRISQGNFTESDVTRMSKLVGEKLRLDTMTEIVTPLTFLQLYHDLCRTLGLISAGERDAVNMEALLAELEACLCQRNLADFHYHVLSLCVLLVNTERAGHTYAASEAAAIIQCLCQISDEDLETCKLAVTEFLEGYQSTVTKKPTSKLQWLISKRTSKALMESVLYTQRMPTITEEDYHYMNDRVERDDCAVADDVTPETEYHVPVSLDGGHREGGWSHTPSTHPDNNNHHVRPSVTTRNSSGSSMQCDTTGPLPPPHHGACIVDNTVPTVTGAGVPSLPRRHQRGVANNGYRRKKKRHHRHTDAPLSPPGTPSPPDDDVVVTPRPAATPDGCGEPPPLSPDEPSDPRPEEPSPSDEDDYVAPRPIDEGGDKPPPETPHSGGGYCSIVDFFRGGMQTSRYPICKLEICQANIPHVKVSFPTMIA